MMSSSHQRTAVFVLFVSALSLAVATDVAALNVAPSTLLGGGTPAVSGVENYAPAVATNGNTAIAVWQSSDRDSPGASPSGTYILVSITTDAGSTWSTPAAIAAGNAGVSTGIRPKIAYAGGTWTVVWTSNDPAHGGIGTDNDIIASRSTDDGATWSVPAAVNSDAATDPTTGGLLNGRNDADPLVAASASTIIVLWQRLHENDTPSVFPNTGCYIARSIDSGATWSGPTPIAVGDDNICPVLFEIRAGFATDGAGTWSTVQSGGGQATSTDDGITWSLRDLVDGESTSDPDLAYANGTWLLANKQSLTGLIQVQRSLSGPENFEPNPIAVSGFGSLYEDDQFYPTIAHDGLSWLVGWAGTSTIDASIVLGVAQSFDNGIVWESSVPVLPGGGRDLLANRHSPIVTFGSGQALMVASESDGTNSQITSAAIQGCETDADCDDANPCTSATCTPLGGCARATVANGTICDDGTICTTADQCTDGQCGGTTVTCDDFDACTPDFCDESLGCLHLDSDGDGDGDDCDTCFGCDSCTVPNFDDTDGDGVGDACDNCLLAPNPSQADIEPDGIGNACDDDPVRPQYSSEEDNCVEGLFTGTLTHDTSGQTYPDVTVRARIRESSEVVISRSDRSSDGHSTGFQLGGLGAENFEFQPAAVNFVADSLTAITNQSYAVLSTGIDFSEASIVDEQTLENAMPFLTVVFDTTVAGESASGALDGDWVEVACEPITVASQCVLFQGSNTELDTVEAFFAVDANGNPVYDSISSASSNVFQSATSEPATTYVTYHQEGVVDYDSRLQVPASGVGVGDISSFLGLPDDHIYIIGNDDDSFGGIIFANPLVSLDEATGLPVDSGVLSQFRWGVGPPPMLSQIGRFEAEPNSALMDPETVEVLVAPCDDCRFGSRAGVADCAGSTCGDSLVGAGEQCDDGDTTNGDGCDANCRREDVATVTNPSGNFEVSTGTNVTAIDPIATSVESPQGGTVSIVETSSTKPSGASSLNILGQKILITAPASTPNDPLRLTFLLHTSLLPTTLGIENIDVSKDGAIVANCVKNGNNAVLPLPVDPCVESRKLNGGTSVQIVVLTSTASTWQLQSTLGACPAQPATGCRSGEPGKSKFQIKKSGENGAKDKLGWKLGKAEASELATFGDPIQGNVGYGLCVYDASDTLLLASTVAPAGSCSGKPCWKVSSKGAQFKDKAAAQGGITQIKMKAGVAGKAQVQVKGAGPALAVPTLPITDATTVQFRVDNGSNLECWETRFTATPNKNDASKYQSKGP